MESRDKKIFGLVLILIIVFGVLCFLSFNKNKNLRLKISNLKSNSFESIDEDILNELSFYDNISDEFSNKYNEYYDNISLLEEKIINGESDVKIAYFTFDDGPYELTLKYLDILKANNIRATFFVLGKEGYDETYKRIVREGHTLANHTYSHNLSSGLYDSVDGFISQVLELEDYLYGITGYKTSIVRFPGGSSTAKGLKDGIVSRLHDMGYNYVDWTSETGDGSSLKLQQKNTWQWYQDTTASKNIIVLLMHDYNYSTLNDLQRIIDDLRNRGFIFLPLFNGSVMVN